MSGIFLSPTNFSSSAFLSGIKRNSTGHIVSATATRMRFWAEESQNFPAQVDRAGQQQRGGQHGGQHGDGGAGGQADSLFWGAAAWGPWRFLCLEVGCFHSCQRDEVDTQLQILIWLRQYEDVSMFV